MPALGYAPGTLSMWFALAAGLGAIASYVRAFSLQAAGGAPFDAAVALARRLYYAFAASIFIASALLLYRLMAHDFRLSYVASYSGRELPFRYLFSTFWAGQEGSFLPVLAVLGIQSGEDFQGLEGGGGRFAGAARSGRSTEMIPSGAERYIPAAGAQKPPFRSGCLPKRR